VLVPTSNAARKPATSSSSSASGKKAPPTATGKSGSQTNDPFGGLK
jgi:hypothetical protein